MKEFLPVSKEDMKKRNWDYYDFLYITGDAYVDHPSFGHAIITVLAPMDAAAVQDTGFAYSLFPTGVQKMLL